MKTAEECARFVWTSPELQEVSTSMRQFRWLTRQFRQAQREAAEETAKGLAFAHQLAVEKAERKGAEEMRKRCAAVVKCTPLPGDEKQPPALLGDSTVHEIFYKRDDGSHGRMVETQEDEK